MHHKRLIFLFLLLLPLLCHAQETGSLHSKHASFDGNVLTLSGNVELHHSLGVLLAEEAILTKQEPHQDFPFSHISLHKAVELLFKDRSKLTCERADLDFLSLKGTLLGERHPIVYSEQLQVKGEPLSLIMQAVHAELTCAKIFGEKGDLSYVLTALQGEQDVHIQYGTQCELSCNRALYDKSNPAHPLLSAFSKEDLGFCRFTRGSDVIDATSATLDIQNAILTLQEPRGVLVSSLEKKSNGSFRAHELFLDHQKHLLTLRGQVVLDEPIFGHLTTNDQLFLKGEEQHRFDFCYAECLGNTELTYQDPATGELHHLTCHGKVTMDRSKHVIYFDSPESVEPLSENEQLFYQGKECHLFADHAIAEYSAAEGRASLVRIHLKGHIRLRTPEMERTAIADRAMYSPLTRTLVLSADPGSQVLFHDVKENVQMQAPEVHLIYDPEQNHTVAKGIGKVRFTLHEEELNQLLHRK